MVVKSALVELLAGLIKRGVLPQATQFHTGDVPMPLDGINQPHIAVEVGFCHIISV
jgi:hypothetical protein